MNFALLPQLKLKPWQLWSGLLLLGVLLWAGSALLQTPLRQNSTALQRTVYQLDHLREVAGEIKAWEQQLALNDQTTAVHQLGLLEQVEQVTRQAGVYGGLSRLTPLSTTNGMRALLGWERLSPTELSTLLNEIHQRSTLTLHAFELRPAADLSGDLLVELTVQ